MREKMATDTGAKLGMVHCWVPEAKEFSSMMQVV
jgi:hypothetical protein